MSRRWRSALALVGVTAVLGCTPNPTPGPRWVTTRLARSVSPSATVNQIGGWTDDDWFASLEVTTIPNSAGTNQIKFFPRSGPGGSVLGAPQVLTPPVSGGLGGPIGEHIVALGSDTAYFYRETAGVWAATGSLALPSGFQLMAMSDEWLAARRVPGFPGATGDGEVRMYSIDGSGPAVVATYVTTLGPDPAWPAGLREGFGQWVVLDGGIVAVTAMGFSGPTPGGVRVFRESAGTWVPYQSLGATTGGPNGFGQTIAVDDGPIVDRLVLAPQSDTNRIVDVYADTGAGFAVEQSLPPPPLDPLATTPEIFGYAAAIDGSLLAVVGHSTSVPSAEVGHAPVGVAHVIMYRRGSATWSREAEVATFPSPYDVDVTSAYPYRLQAAGNHVAATVLVSPDPPPNCPFPCFNLGIEAWSLDRR